MLSGCTSRTYKAVWMPGWTNYTAPNASEWAHRDAMHPLGRLNQEECPTDEKPS